MSALALVPMAGDIDLSASWDTFWTAVSGPAGPILSLLSVVGVLLVVMALVKWAWDRRRGGGGGMGQQSSAVWGALLVGSILSAPNILIPMLLLVMDVIANAGISVFNSGAA